MIWSEFRNAWRRLAARPGYTSLSVVVLSLGLGSMLFLLGAVNGFILSPLPFPHADRLVALGYLSRDDTTGIDGMDVDDYLKIREELKSFELFGGYTTATVNLNQGQVPKRYAGGLFTVDVLAMTGAQPILGRTFTADDDRPDAPLVVLLGERAWRDDFGGDPDVLGRAVRANSQPATIIGVLPESFRFPRTEEVWMPRRAKPGDEFGLDAMGRLKPGVSLAAARAEWQAVAERLGQNLDGMRDLQETAIKPLAYAFVNENTRRFLWLMFATSMMVLMLACANVANLQFTQTLARSRELALRSALGAQRRRLLLSVLMETFAISLISTVFALAIAHVGGQWIIDTLIANEDSPAYFVHARVDGRMLAFGVVAAFVTTIAAGLIPALRASGSGAQAALRDGDRSGSGGRFAKIVRGLVVAEIALTLVLLVGAGMFVRALDGLVKFDFGTSSDPNRVLTARIGLFPEDFPTGAEQTRFFKRVADAVRAEPGVEAVTASNTVPGFSSSAEERIAIAGEPKPAEGYPSALVGAVDAYFLDTYGVRVLEGRGIELRDDEASAPVAVVDRKFADAMWPGRSAIGQQFRLDPEDAEQPLRTVVGVTVPLHLEDVDDDKFPTVLLPLAQLPSRFATLSIRHAGDPMAFVPRLAEIVRAQNPDTPIYWPRTHQRALEMARVGPLIVTQIFGAVGLLGLALAAAGLYGVLAFAVTQRTREIGIRRAIGASPGGVVKAVGRRIFAQVAIGLAIGVALSIPWARMLSEGTWDARAPVSIFVVAIGTIALAALAAALVPLRRALRVDPMQALRYE